MTVSLLEMGSEPCFDAKHGEDINKYHFCYINPDEKTQTYLENARANYRGMLIMLHSIPPSRERSLAITELEKSLMFCTKAIVVASKYKVPE